ncbi:hypothetical protein [Actinoplanes awajinensis]|uniref:Uncharacterized protein n=1 Tax=Actinoplanes awajinensis subsp. mycoplanecinus TaxID=135947 RepID=A0A101JB56_9ACTN|nr:hypothetical protein [Actinoplanes awajinensis]KUL23540.1 hypothetical protein ADL15_46070 [Actinoplanes awajinensis subsp. mycoplanecinus]
MTVGDPRGDLDRKAGRRHNLRVRQWQIGRSLQILQDKPLWPGWSRTVEPVGTCPVPAGPGVIHAAARRHQDQLAG